MIDIQTAADGVGRLRVRHAGGSEGILTSVAFRTDDGPMLRRGGNTLIAMEPARFILTVALEDGGQLEAPQQSMEAMPDGTAEARTS